MQHNAHTGMERSRRTIGWLRPRPRGQAMVEFAMSVPVLLLLMLVIVELGHVLFSFASIYAAAREAARYGAAVDDTGAAIKYLDADGIRAAAKGIGFFNGLDDSQIVIQYDCGVGTAKSNTVLECPRGKMLRVSVQVSTTYIPIVPIPKIDPFPISSTVVRTIVQKVGLEGKYPTRIAPTPIPTPSCDINMVLTDSRSDSMMDDPATYPQWYVIRVHSDDRWMTLTYVEVASKAPNKIKLEKLLVDPEPNPLDLHNPDAVDNNIRWEGSDSAVKISLGGTKVGDSDHLVYLKFAPGAYTADVTFTTSCPADSGDMIPIAGGVP